MSREQPAIPLDDLFDRLVDLPPAERSAEALRLAAGNVSLAEEAIALVAAHESAELANQQARAREPVPEKRRFGVYSTIRVLGSGGTGTVYLAERTDGQYHQQVAVKALSPHAAGPLLRGRFLAERQILAGLNHANIARLLDGNISEEGDPYLVLEYVDGTPLDQYCDQARLPVAGRIDLFLKVCEAVDFAHRQLVIHRDLKPSNILVDRSGEPKLLDFGTARLLSPDATGAASVPMLTPRYASPEQLRSQPMSVSTDVYSLGIILYELLTGSWPFGSPADAEVSIRRILDDLMPAAPETVIADEAASLRATSSGELRTLLRGDLTTILGKALDADPSRRYPTVRELAQDLLRYRQSRPILARPHTLSYRARKFIRRNRLGVTFAGLLICSVLLGTSAALWQARESQKARQRAESRFQQVRKLANYLVFDIHGGLQRLPGATGLQRQVVEQSLAYLDILSREASTDESLRIELAEAYLRLGDVLGNPYRPSLGDAGRALESYQKALAFLGTGTPKANARRVAAAIHIQRGATIAFRGDRTTGIAEIRSAVDELTRLAESEPGTTALRLALARGLDALANQSKQSGGSINSEDPFKTEKLYLDALKQLDLVIGRDPHNEEALRQLAQTEYGLGLLWGSSDPTRSIPHLQKASQWLDQLPAADQGGIDIRRLRASILLNTGWAQGQIRDYNAALRSIAGSATLLEAITIIDPANTSARYQMTSVYRARGIVHGYQQNHAAAAADFERAAAIHHELSEKDPKNLVYRYLRGELLARAGSLYVSLGRPAEAEQRTAAGLALLVELADRPKAATSHLTAACRWLIETKVAALRNPQKAIAYCQAALDHSAQKDIDAWQGVAAGRSMLGDVRGARDAAQRGLALLPPVEPGQKKPLERIFFEDILRN